MYSKSIGRLYQSLLTRRHCKYLSKFELVRPESNYICRSSTNQSQAVLAQLSRDTRDIKEISLSVDERLSKIQHSFLQTRGEVFIQTDVAKRNLLSTTPNDHFQPRSFELQSVPPSFLGRGFLETTIRGDKYHARLCSSPAEDEPDSAKTLLPDDELKPAPDSFAKIDQYPLPK